MIRFREPLTADIRDFLNNNALTDFSYGQIGCTRGKNVSGFNTDRLRIELGVGEETLEKAKRSLRDWRQFSTDWVRLCWPYKKLTPGTVIAVVAHHYGFYSVNALRIVYVVDEPTRFGLGIGTLLRHIVRGEMAFLVYQEDSGKVFYEIVAISRPGHWLTWIFYPIGRNLQTRFMRDSLHALLTSLLNQPPPRRTATPTADPAA